MTQELLRPPKKFDEMSLEQKQIFAEFIAPHVIKIVKSVKLLFEDKTSNTIAICKAIEVLLGQGYFIVKVQEISKLLGAHLVSFCVYTENGYVPISEEIIYKGKEKCHGIAKAQRNIFPA